MPHPAAKPSGDHADEHAAKRAGDSAAAAVRLGLIAGANVLDHAPFQGAVVPHAVHTPHGEAEVLLGRTAGRDFALVLRHGPDGATAPHRINHRANLAALQALGVTACVSYCSVGSLRPHIAPGELLVASDFINLSPVLTVQEHAPRFVTPVVSERLRLALFDALADAGQTAHREGVYYQSIGPRLETRAEVRLMAQFADVVGMTWGHEATLACEMGLEMACLCSVDNMAHGLAAAADVDGPTLGEHILREKAAQAGRFGRIAQALIGRLA